MKDGHITQSTLDMIVEKLDGELQETYGKLREVLQSSDRMIKRRDELLDQVEAERDSYAKLLKEAEEKISNLEYQIEQRDKTIAKAHNLLVLEKFYYPEKTTHFEESLKESLA